MSEQAVARPGGYLRQHRLRITLWVAVVEGILVVVHVIPWWLAVVVAALAVLFYYQVGRGSKSDTVRQASWIVAASQALVALVPILVIVVGTLALVAVAILAVLALIALFTERR